MGFKVKSEKKLEGLRRERLERDRRNCTFNPAINAHSQKIFGEYQRRFQRRKSRQQSRGPRARKGSLKRHKSQASLRKKTYHKMHSEKKRAEKLKTQNEPAAIGIRNNEYLAGFDRNRRGSVFEHLYRQRKVRESKQMQLFERVQQRECPFQPRRLAKSSVKSGGGDFFKRSERFQRKKRLFRESELARMRSQMFQPNLHRKASDQPRSGIHEELYKEGEKENIRRQRLVERYEVETVTKAGGEAAQPNRADFEGVRQNAGAQNRQKTGRNLRPARW